MERFRDKTGQEWTIELTIGLVERVKRATKYDLYSPNDPLPAADGQSPGPPLQQVLWTDYSALYELLWYLLEDQMQAAGIDAAEFGRRIAARCLLDAQKALFREWCDFFRQLERWELLLSLEKMLQMAEAAGRVAQQKVRDPRLAKWEEEAERAVETLAEQRLTAALSDGYGRLRALSESTPGP